MSTFQNKPQFNSHLLARCGLISLPANIVTDPLGFIIRHKTSPLLPLTQSSTDLAEWSQQMATIITLTLTTLYNILTLAYAISPLYISRLQPYSPGTFRVVSDYTTSHRNMVAHF